MEISAQAIINGLIGFVILLGGWVIKLVLDKIKVNDEKTNEARASISTCQSQIMSKITELEIRDDHQTDVVNDMRVDMATNYVMKSDLQRSEDKIMARFDKFEIKLDQVIERRLEPRE